MRLQMIEKEDDFLCAGKHIGEQIILVLFDPGLKGNQRLLCQKCLQYIKLHTNLQGFQIILETIHENCKDRQNMQQFLIEKMTRFIEPLEKAFQSIKDKIINSLEAINKSFKSWLIEFQQMFNENISYSFFDELELLVQKQTSKKQQQILQQINKINQSHINKVFQKFQALKEFPNDFDHISQKLKTLEDNLSSEYNNYYGQQGINDKIVGKNINIKEISRVQSEKGITNIVFNQKGSIMISTTGTKVEIWKFDKGSLTLQSSFIAHKQDIKSILLSNQNIFIITTGDKTIKIFQQNNEIVWKNVYEFSKLKESVDCMIINSSESFLFSSSLNTICVWRVNYQQKQMLTHLQTLEQHKWAINAISLNKSETTLVSCGKDNKLIIWGLNGNNQWQYKYDVKQSILQNGNGVYFLKDNQFIWISGELHGKDSIYVYEEKFEIFVEVFKKTLKLPISQNEWFISPVVYIQKQKNIILVQQKNYINLIRENDNGIFEVVYQINRTILNYQQSQSLAQDGKYLIYSYCDTKDDKNYFSINEIQYQ